MSAVIAQPGLWLPPKPHIWLPDRARVGAWWRDWISPLVVGYSRKFGGGAPSPAYVTTYTDTGGVTDSVTGANIGTAHASRVVVVCYQTLNSDLPTGLTIGGVSATKIAEATNGGSNPASQIWALAVASGTAANIAWTGRPSDTNGQQIGIFALYPASTTATGAGDGVDTSTGTATTTAITVTNGGFLVFSAAWNTSNTATASWTGIDSPTVDYQGAINTTANRFAGHGSMIVTASSTTDTLTISGTSSTKTRVCAAAWT